MLLLAPFGRSAATIILFNLGVVAKYLPSRQSGEVSIPKATIHLDFKE